MKKLLALVIFLGGLLPPMASPAADFKQAKFTQVVNDVGIITADKTKKSVVVDDIFNMPDVLRTGADSRAELVAADNTITRVGANTIFSFDEANRTVDLQQGSLLFHSPKGKGGGSIRTGSATASVLGTTIIVTATPNGGFKLLDLEGSAEIKFLNGLSQRLQPGQMTFILPGGQHSPIVIFRLDEQTKGSKLVGGFEQPLPSLPKIEAEVTKQLGQILSGQAEDTGLLVGNNASASQVQVVVDNFNSSHAEPVNPDLAAALQDHVVISTATLSDVSPSHVFLKPFVTGNAFLDSFRKFSGFVAKNIDITTPTIDLSPYAAIPGTVNATAPGTGNTLEGESVFVRPNATAPTVATEPVSFDFVAADTLHIQNDLAFSGLTPADSINLFAGNQLLIDASKTISVVNPGVARLGLVTAHSLSLDNVCIENPGGQVGLVAGGDISLFDGGSISAADSLDLRAGGNVMVRQSSAINVKSGSVNLGGTFTLDNSSVNIASGGSGFNVVASGANGNISLLNNATITTPGYLKLDAGQNLSIANSMLNFASADLNAGDTFTLDNSTLNVMGGYLDVLNGAGGINIMNSVIDPASSVVMSSFGNITVLDTDLSAASAAGVNGTIDINSLGGTLTLNQGSGMIGLSAGGDISLAGKNGADIQNTTVNSANGAVAFNSSAGLITLDSDQVGAAGNIAVAGAGNVRVTGSTFASSAGSFSINGSVTGGNPNTTGRDVTINDTGITATGGSIALKSAGKLTLDQSASANGRAIHAGTDVDIYGSSDINLTLQGTALSSIKADTGGLDINSSAGVFSVVGGTLEAGGLVNINGQNSVSISGTTVTSDNDSVTIQSPSHAVLLSSSTVSAVNNVTVTGIGVSMDGAAINASAANSTITVNNNSGVMLAINRPAFQAGYITLNSGDGILVDGASFAGNRADINVANQSGHVANIRNADFTGVANANISAHTINLLNVNFDGASTVNLKSFFGSLAANPNTGQASSPGYVNFINGVSYGGNPAQNYVNPVGSGVTAGIFISRLP